ncbi:phosphotransferase enzyme family protein [Fodinicola feengrottensis]|nr:phosphotransferase [Fodinicola feengrottensis]
MPDSVQLLQYEDNAVYLVVRNGKSYVLRISVVDGRSPAAQASELEWLLSLAAEKTTVVPTPVATRSSELVVTSALNGSDEPVTSALFEWIPGAAPRHFGPELAAELGRVMARLHEHASGYRPSAPFERPAWGHQEVFDLGATMTSELAWSRLTSADRSMLREVSKKVRDRMPTVGDDWALIHADLHRGNVVVMPTGEVAVIDFDDCGWGHYMLDIATMLSSILRTCLDDRDEYARLAAEYLAGYREVRNLPASSSALNEFLVLRDMIILNFMVSSRNDAVVAYMPQRGNGILALMCRYLRTGLYDGFVSLEV